MCTSRIRVVVGVMMGALGLVSSMGFAATPACLDGRYLVFRQTLLGAATADKLDGVTLQGGAVALDSGCPLQPAHVTTTRSGTKIAASWDRCGALAGVRLRAVVTGAGCDVVNGSVVVRQQPTRPFTGRRSSCGDGVVDGGAGEACEHDADCGGGGVCTACACDVVSTTTTTTTTSTTMLPPTGARLQVAVDPPDAGFVMGPGIDCGTADNGTVSSQCGSNLAPDSAVGLHVTQTNFRYDFVGWTGCQENVPGNALWCSTTMHGDQVAVARFARRRHYLLEASQLGMVTANFGFGVPDACFYDSWLGVELDLTIVDSGSDVRATSHGHHDIGVTVYLVQNTAPDRLVCGDVQTAFAQFAEDEWIVRATSAWPDADTIYLKGLFPVSEWGFPPTTADAFAPAVAGYVRFDGTVGADDVLHGTFEFFPNAPLSTLNFQVNVTASPSPGV